MTNTDDEASLEAIAQFDQYQAVQEIFKDVEFPDENFRMTARYPEVLLQQSDKANRYYSSFQRYTQQFINQKDTGSMVRWSDSAIESNQRLIIGSWTGADVKGSTAQSTKGKKKPTSAPSALFAWSSGDSYIRARKLELQMKRGELFKETARSHADTTESEMPETNTKNIVKINRSKESIFNKLNKTVEMESNKFIHARIQVIKAHHSEEISKQIHDRKRRDHELQLQKLRLKEEEYEKELKAATNEQTKQGGFFNSLFGFNAATSNGDAETPTDENRPSTPTTPAVSKGTKSSKSKRFSFLPGAKRNDGKKKDNGGDVLFDTDKEAKEVQEAEEAQEDQNVPGLSKGYDTQEQTSINLDGVKVDNAPSQVDGNSSDSDFEDFTSSGPTNTPVQPEKSNPPPTPPKKPIPPQLNLSGLNKHVPITKKSLPMSIDSPVLSLTPTTKRNITPSFPSGSSSAQVSPGSGVLSPRVSSTSSTPISHKFIPMSKPAAPLGVNADLIDIFGSSQAEPAVHPKKRNSTAPSASEDLLQF